MREMESVTKPDFTSPESASAAAEPHPSDSSCRSMDAAELRRYLRDLGLTQVELAQLLGTNPRTVRRWLEATEGEAGIPGPAASAVRAWGRLCRAGLAWRPGDVMLVADDPQIVGELRFHELGVDAAVQRVLARGGPTALWDVDLNRQRATLGSAQLTFMLLARGGFAPLSYRRLDTLRPDPSRDAHLIEDCYTCIARALARVGRAPRPPLRLGPARIVNGTDLVMWEQRESPTLALRVPLVTARAILGAAASDAELKVFVELNGDKLLAMDAYERLADARQVNSLGVREVVATETLLRRVAPGVVAIAERMAEVGEGA